MVGAVFIPYPNNAASEVMANAVEYVCAEIERDTKLWCPVDTGNLRRSYVHAVDRGQDPAGFVGTSVYYGPFVEFGTSRMTAQPHLGKGANAAVGRGHCHWVEGGSGL